MWSNVSLWSLWSLWADIALWSGVSLWSLWSGIALRTYYLLHQWHHLLLLVLPVLLRLSRPEVPAALLVPADLLDPVVLVDRRLYSTSRSTQAHDSSANFLCCQR